MILKISNLTVTYSGGVKALDGVSFDVPQGQICAVVGESGSGKSTLAYALMNLLPLDARTRGDMIVENGARVGLIMQDPAGTFNPILTLGYQFEEIANCKLQIADSRKRKEIIFEALRLAHVLEPERILKRYPHQVSVDSKRGVTGC